MVKWSRWESNPRPLECHAEAGVYGRCATVRNRARNQALASVQAARRAPSRTVRPAQPPHTRLPPFRWGPPPPPAAGLVAGLGSRRPPRRACGRRPPPARSATGLAAPPCASSYDPEHDRRPLDGPERTQRSDRVAWQRLNPAGPADLELAERPFQEDDQQHERYLADRDADVEAQERQGQLGPRQSGAGQRTGKAETMEEAEEEGHHPRLADGQTRLAAPRAHDLRAKKQNAERDGGVQRQHRRAGIAERGDRERDAVGNRERGHGLQQHPPVLDDQQQAEHEEQVLTAEYNLP